MPKYKKAPPLSSETFDTAMSIAKGTQKPNQTKEQTKLIAQGIQKGIAEYKKQQKGKARELDKLKKKIIQQQNNNSNEVLTDNINTCKVQWLPWALLAISWLTMTVWIMRDVLPD